MPHRRRARFPTAAPPRCAPASTAQGARARALSARRAGAAWQRARRHSRRGAAHTLSASRLIAGAAALCAPSPTPALALAGAACTAAAALDSPPRSASSREVCSAPRSVGAWRCGRAAAHRWCRGVAEPAPTPVLAAHAARASRLAQRSSGPMASAANTTEPRSRATMGARTGFFYSSRRPPRRDEKKNSKTRKHLQYCKHGGMALATTGCVAGRPAHRRPQRVQAHGLRAAPLGRADNRLGRLRRLLRARPARRGRPPDRRRRDRRSGPRARGAALAAHDVATLPLPRRVGRVRGGPARPRPRRHGGPHRQPAHRPAQGGGDRLHGAGRDRACAPARALAARAAGARRRADGRAVRQLPADRACTPLRVHARLRCARASARSARHPATGPS